MEGEVTCDEGSLTLEATPEADCWVRALEQSSQSVDHLLENQLAITNVTTCSILLQPVLDPDTWMIGCCYSTL